VPYQISGTFLLCRICRARPLKPNLPEVRRLFTNTEHRHDEYSGILVTRSDDHVGYHHD